MAKIGNKEALLAGARACLVDRGWAGTTVRDIAEAAGVSHAAIGYHFGSRDALLSQALVEAVDELGAKLAGRREGDDPRQRASALLDSFRTDRDLWVVQLEAVVQAARSDEVRAHLAAGQQRAREHLGGSIPLAIGTGLMIQSIVEPDQSPTSDELATALESLAANP